MKGIIGKSRMKICDYLVKSCLENGVSDVFGIPGGVVLDFVYALGRQEKSIRTHLMYHEQCAGFAAAGYAQSGGNIGVAFATKGPGVLNICTAVADAYYDSIAMLVVTAHSMKTRETKMRIVDEQEMSTKDVFGSISKDCIIIEDEKEAKEKIDQAFLNAQSGRKGPVVIDVLASIWNKDIVCKDEQLSHTTKSLLHDEKQCRMIIEELKQAERPIFLIGDGIRQSGVQEELTRLVNKLKIPVLSSRGSQSILGGNEFYYGYIGSHGIRYSNFILAKSDLIISLGNRMAFPVASKSFCETLSNSLVLRCEMDENEFERNVPNCENVLCDVKNLIPNLLNAIDFSVNKEWRDVCNVLYKELNEYDTEYPVDVICDCINQLDKTYCIVSDVGNNEFWLSRAYEYSRKDNEIFYSRSFGALGCAIGKAIGVYYQTMKPVICFVGDQGFQMNIQELQFISGYKLPITVVVINNKSSGMIKSREIRKFNSEFRLTTSESGYLPINVEMIASAYGINYNRICEKKESNIIGDIQFEYPNIIEMVVDPSVDLELSLPFGEKCQNMFPEISREKYNVLNEL